MNFHGWSVWSAISFSISGRSGGEQEGFENKPAMLSAGKGKPLMALVPG